MTAADDAAKAAAGAARRCPICGKPGSAEASPFCSRRCADVDLNRWLSGAYAIATVEPPADNDGGNDE